MKFSNLVLLALSLHIYPAFAQPTPAPDTQHVVVVGKQSDTAARREFVAGKIIISRKTIAQSDAENVAALLKREPAISVSAGGRIGLLGLPGYTQVLVDGAPPLPGKGLSQLALVHVEKIEIVKSALAEFGPFGIAGTINVITRKTERKSSTVLSAGARSTDGQPGVSASLSHNQGITGLPLLLSTYISAARGNSASASNFSLTSQALGQAPLVEWDGVGSSKSRDRNIDGSVNLTWEAGPGNTVTLSPNGGRSVAQQTISEDRSYANGSKSNALSRVESTFALASLPLSWSFKPDPTSQVESKARITRIQVASGERRLDTGGANFGLRERRQESTALVRNIELNYKVKLANSHDVKLGASATHTRETIEYLSTTDGAVDPYVDLLGAQRFGATRNVRLFVQDDWRMNESLAFNFGLSGQHTAIDLTEGKFGSRPRYRLLSPSMHVLKNVGADDKRQVRLSFATTFRAPDRGDLSLRPSIHPLAPCAASSVCSTNSIDTRDSAGNPDLQPERSQGLNLSYEHGLGDDSTLTVEVYARHIRAKIGTEILLANVPWSSSPRYVSRPANLGEARVQGLSLEMSLALRDLSKEAPRLDLRGNINLARSEVSNLPGPDNRLDKQTPWSAKLGASYRVPGWPLKFEIDGNWAPGVWVRSNLSQRVAIPRRFDVDASMAWTFVGGRRLNFSVSDIAPRTAISIHEFETAQGQVRLATETPRFRSFAVRLNTPL